MNIWEILAEWFRQQTEGFEAEFQGIEPAGGPFSGQVGPFDLGAETTVETDFNADTLGPCSVNATVEGWTGYAPLPYGGIELDNRPSDVVAEFHYFFAAPASRFLSSETYEVTAHIRATGLFTTLCLPTSNNPLTSPEGRRAFARGTVLARVEVENTAGDLQSFHSEGEPVFSGETTPSDESNAFVVTVDRDLDPFVLHPTGEDIIFRVIIGIVATAQGNANRIVVSELFDNPGFELEVTRVRINAVI
jgi:hypothetical protein